MEAAFTAIETCSELRFLITLRARHFGDHYSEKIDLNAPHLKRSEIRPDVCITTEALLRSMTRRVFRHPSSLSCLYQAEIAWHEAFLKEFRLIRFLSLNPHVTADFRAK